MPPFFGPTGRLDARSLKLHIRRSPATALKRRTRTYGHVDFPRNPWDRMVLLAFTFCLFTFLHAILGFGTVDEDLGVLLNNISELSGTLSVSTPWSWGAEASNADQEVRAPGVAVTQMIVDWHGVPQTASTTSALVASASVLQVAFPDPTPAQLDGARRGRAVGSPAVATRDTMPAVTPFVFYERKTYDPFRLKFGVGRLYPIAEPPKTASRRGVRARRFGRCLSGEVCL